MKTILYISAHEPYPARSGGQVDIWNRLRSLQQLGITVDLIVTAKRPLSAEQMQALSGTVRRLFVVRRSSLIAGLVGRLPVQMAVRSRLSSLDLAATQYDLALLDNEFTGEVLRNPTLRARQVVIRVQNDEEAYQRKLAATEKGLFRRTYFLLEARRMRIFLPKLWKRVHALWFISSDELARFREWARAETAAGAEKLPTGTFLPAGLDLCLAGHPPLSTGKVLFVGTLAVTLNQEAVRWYLERVHPLLLDLPAYEFLVAGSTLGSNLEAFRREIEKHPRVRMHCDVPDLQPLFDQSSVFVSPMRHGAGVKLKTVEAALRGLPLVTTSVGAEGSGLVDGVHCHVADRPDDFASSVRAMLSDAEQAIRMRDRACEYICNVYNHSESLRLALQELGIDLSAE